MKTVLITGASGFLGLNLQQALLHGEKGYKILLYDRLSPGGQLTRNLSQANAVCHFEAIYKGASEQEYNAVNVELTREIIADIERVGKPVDIVYASSTQAESSTSYGSSRRKAEDILEGYAGRTGSLVAILRLANEFGKWCLPNHNSVVATFCHQLTHGLEIEVKEPARVLNLVYIDDIMKAVLNTLAAPTPGFRFVEVSPTFPITVGALAETLKAFSENRRNLFVPDFSDGLISRLYATYLSHLDGSDFAYSLDKRGDARGELAEYFKSPHFGQVFVSRTHPGVTRGNHYHDTKAEKFCILEGEALVRFRHMVTGERVDHRVKGDEFRVVDIPPGWTHSIENVGDADLIVLFWASEIFDPENPDTFPSEVQNA